MADPSPQDELKKRYLLTAGFEDQEALMAPPFEWPVEHPLPSALLAVLDAGRGEGRAAAPVSLPAMHRFVVDPSAHPAWDEVVARVLAAGMPAWAAQVLFRLALLGLHADSAETRAAALGRLAAELDAQLTPGSTLMVGPARVEAPAASPVAAPRLGGVALFAGLDLVEAAPEAVMSLMATLTGWAVWHAPSVQVYGPLEGALPAPLDLVVALATAMDKPVERIAVPVAADADERPILEQLASGWLVRELAAARRLAEEDRDEAIRRLPGHIRRAPIPAARVALMGALAVALRGKYGLAAPPPDGPGFIAQITAQLASPLASVYRSALAELDALAEVDDARALGLDLPSRYPTALAATREALARRKTVPRWVIANIQGADRALVCAWLLGRLPSADPILVRALVDLAPAELEPALHETLRESWVPAAAKAEARHALRGLGRLD